MAFAPRPGCPMCGIVSSASTSTAILTHSLSDAHSRPLAGQSRRASRDTSSPDILYRDDNFTVYEERDNAISSRGHIVLCFNLHVPSIYSLSSSDVPLLIQLQEIATRLLSYFTEPAPSPHPSPNINPLQTSPSSPISPSSGSFPRTFLTQMRQQPFHIGFITPPMRDPKIPITDHLHAHAFIGDMDQVKWYEIPRKLAFTVGWWDISDLIAEIREQTSNNRVKSGAAYNVRPSTGSPYQPNVPTLLSRPINQVPAAGAREGLPNGMEVTTPSLQSNERDLEAGLNEDLDGHEATLSPPLHGMTTPRIVTSPPPIDTSSSASGNGASDWSLVSPPRPGKSRSGSRQGSGETGANTVVTGPPPEEASTSTSTSGSVLNSPPPDRPISALEI